MLDAARHHLLAHIIAAYLPKHEQTELKCCSKQQRFSITLNFFNSFSLYVQTCRNHIKPLALVRRFKHKSFVSPRRANTVIYLSALRSLSHPNTNIVYIHSLASVVFVWWCAQIYSNTQPAYVNVWWFVLWIPFLYVLSIAKRRSRVFQLQPRLLRKTTISIRRARSANALDLKTAHCARVTKGWIFFCCCCCWSTIVAKT